MPGDDDYEAICAAVMETDRGRWFLGEYARRNRQSDTAQVLAAIARVEAATRREADRPAGKPAAEVGTGAASGSDIERLRGELAAMASAIARTKQEIAAIRPDAEPSGRILEATEQLDNVVKTTERATSDILAAAEQVQEVAWTMREQGMETEFCDKLDGYATAIYMACSFQDLTGQRTRKIIHVLRYLETRLEAMMDIWAPQTASAGADHGSLVQNEIDHVMTPPAAGLAAFAGTAPPVDPQPTAPAVASPPDPAAANATAPHVAAPALTAPDIALVTRVAAAAAVESRPSSALPASPIAPPAPPVVAPIAAPRPSLAPARASGPGVVGAAPDAVPTAARTPAVTAPPAIAPAVTAPAVTAPETTASIATATPVPGASEPTSETAGSSGRLCDPPPAGAIPVVPGSVEADIIAFASDLMAEYGNRPVADGPPQDDAAPRSASSPRDDHGLAPRHRSTTVAPVPEAAAAIVEAAPSDPKLPLTAAPSLVDLSPPATPPRSPGGPAFADVMALSEEERIALFT